MTPSNHTMSRLALIGLLIACLAVPAVFAQETTGGVQGTVKDPSGAVITKANVVLTSPALLGEKKLETDAGGYYHFVNLPAGSYTLSVTAQGFRPYKQSGIDVLVGHLPTMDVTMAVGSSTETVEVSAEAPLVDVTQSRVQTNITQDVLANVPKGRSFQSVIQFAPGARTEPLQSSSGNRDNGYQIGGASNTENAYLVEGQETASPFDGHTAANVPMEFIQEVQVKTNGFEAEYGGALGGVVNVIQKRGGNEWHGDVFGVYAGDAFNAAPNRQLRRNPSITTNAGGAKRLDQPAEFYQPIKDGFRQVIPGFDVSGPIFKNRLTTFVSFAPEFDSYSRTIKFNSSSPTGAGSRTFQQHTNTYYTNARLDYLLTQKIRVFGSWTYSYARTQGSTLPGADSPYGQVNTSAGNSADNYNYGLAVRYPNAIYNFGGDVTLTNNLVATTRFGLFKFDNGQTAGTPVGIQYTYRDTNYPYATGNAPAPATTKALNGTLIPSQFVGAAGFANIGGNTATAYDAWKSSTFNQDLSWFVKFYGTHTFKVGYAFRKGENNIQSGYNTADVYVAYNTTYFPNVTSGITNCNAIIAQNMTRYGVAGGTPNSDCQGLWGTVNFRELGTTGKVGGWNHSIYVQDAWTINNRLTLNLGVRMDKETLPSYNSLPGFKGIDFGWGQKVAPRLGAAYDLLGNGKLKIYGSYGKFFDIMKFQLPRGSFGGDYWHDCVYALDVPDWTQLIPTRDASSGHYCGLGGGTVQATGSFPTGGLRFIENIDYRDPANDPTQVGTLGATGLVDPKLKPMQQHQYVIGSSWEINPRTGFEVTYNRQRLDRTIEDVGIGTPNGEIFYIENPGFDENKQEPASECNGCPINPKAYRNYDAIDFRLIRRGSPRLNGTVSYSYSRLYGNYSGLTATDISDGGAGRNGANTDRAFDEPQMQWDSHGRAITDGSPLPTDRPHTFKAYGYYTMKWMHMTSDIGIYQYVYSGTPLSSYTSVNPDGGPVFVEGRGKFINLTRDPTTGAFVAGAITSRRTPIFSNTDFNLVHSFHVSKTNERLVVKLEANIANIFNQHSPLIITSNMVRTGSINPGACGGGGGTCPATNTSGGNYKTLTSGGYDYINGQGGLNSSSSYILSSLYNLPQAWQAPRNMRFKFSFSF